MLFGGPSEPDPEQIRVPSKMRVLITVKASPNPSASHGETVCVAGLRLDAGHESWVRLYPINFRFMDGDHAFHKYDVVTLDATPASEGRRESWKPRIDSIQTVGHIDGWPKRMPHLQPFAQPTMCSINRSYRTGPSLGLVRARLVQKLVITPHPGWSPDEQQKIDNYVAQAELFDMGRPKTALEAPRFKVAYRWKCLEPTCAGHEQGILDWELSAFQRRLPTDDDQARAQIQQRWFSQLCGPEKDVYFYVGNQAKRRNIFSVLGVVYPPK
jgi:hypothetical protein